MTIQISLKRNDWVFHTGPWFRNFAFGRRTQISGHSDFGILRNFGACKRILRRLLVLRNPAVWRWYPWLLLLSFVMLMILVRWILHKTPNRLFQYRLGVQLDRFILGTFGSNSEFLTWQVSIKYANCIVLPPFLASSITSFCFRFSSVVMPVFSLVFSHFLSTAASASGLLILEA